MNLDIKLQYTQNNKPQILIKDRFIIEIIEQSDYQEIIELFEEGYASGNPFFKALNIPKKDIREFFELNTQLRFPIEYLPQYPYIYRDIQKNNKIIGCSLSKDFRIKTRYPQSMGEGLQFKQYLDNKLFSQLSQDFIENGKISYGWTCILPEYQSQGILTASMRLGYYQMYKLGTKCVVDIYYNIASDKVLRKYKNFKQISQVNIQEEYFKGEQIFKNNKQLCAICYKTEMNYDFFNNQPKMYSQETLEIFEQFVQSVLKYVNHQKPKL